MRSFLKVSLLALQIILCTLLFSCKRSKPQPAIKPPVTLRVDLRDTLANYAKYAYYWNSNIPLDTLVFNPHAYSANDSLYSETEAIKKFSPLDPLTGKNLDRFSFVITQAEFKSFGTSSGYGLEFRFDINGLYHIRNIAHASQAYQMGVRRGWEVTNVNGLVPEATSTFFTQLGAALQNSPINITFKDPDGVNHSFTFTSANINDDEVVMTQVKDTVGKKIGYMVYNTFLPIGTTNNLHPGLDTAFRGLQARGITDLILDLRYNGGGYVDIVENMANALIPAGNEGKIIFSEIFNQNLKSYNSSTFVNKRKSTNPPSLSLNNIVFIVSEGTASASELIINSLLPYFPKLKLVGVSLGRSVSQKTAGKPFGFFNDSIPSVKPQFQAFLINDETKNALGADNYTAGFTPDIQVPDGVQYDWGNLQEYGYSTALKYLVSGSLSFAPSKVLNLAIKRTTEQNLGFHLANDQSLPLNRLNPGMIHFKGRKVKP
jgi:carboxyl-terminal processing protease